MKLLTLAALLANVEATPFNASCAQLMKTSQWLLNVSKSLNSQEAKSAKEELTRLTEGKNQAWFQSNLSEEEIRLYNAGYFYITDDIGDINSDLTEAFAKVNGKIDTIIGYLYEYKELKMDGENIDITEYDKIVSELLVDMKLNGYVQTVQKGIKKLGEKFEKIHTTAQNQLAKVEAQTKEKVNGYQSTISKL